MVSPDWDLIAEKYIYKDVVDGQRDLSIYFGDNAKRRLHDRVEKIRMQKIRARLAKLSKKPHKNKMAKFYPEVKNSNKYLKTIQDKLFKEKKVVRYIYKGKEIVRNNIRWSPEELIRLRTDYAEKKSDKVIGEELGRSAQAVRRQRQKQGIGTMAISSIPKKRRPKAI